MMKYTEFKERVMAAAASRGLTEYELYAEEKENISAETLNHEISAFSSGNVTGACFRCVSQGKLGYASTELYTLSEAERVVEAAMENAACLETEGEALIHGPGDTYTKVEAGTVTEPTASQLTGLAMKIEEAAYAADLKVADGSQSGAVFYRNQIYLSNSRGLDLTHENAYTMAYCSPIAKEGEEMFSGFYSVGGDFAGLDPQAIAQKGVEDAVSQIGARILPTGTYDVMFSNHMTAALLRVYANIFSAEAAQKGMSPLAGKEGEPVAAPCVTLTDDPFCGDSLVRVPFDGEGVATSRRDVVKEGRLVTLLYNLAAAHRAGVASTGNGVKAGYAAPVSIQPHNFYLQKGGGGTTEEMYEKLGDGVYITELNGMHAGANPVTGDFSLASAGFLIEKGKKTGPVKDFTVSGNFYQLLQDISLVGDDWELRPPMRGGSCFGGPSFIVRGMSIGGK
ncbi:MAG: TldD/PmbA family protein [Lachnospiraceae bacterium]|nr:TldD/PmbA family protein [Lachnospiraceae bacterium]